MRVKLTEPETSGFVKCRECNSEAVFMVTQAAHHSIEPIQIGENGYVGRNSNYSWKIEDGTERFVCDNCGRSWKVDKPVHWVWDE